MINLLAMSMVLQICIAILGFLVGVTIIYILLVSLFFRKVKQGKALVRTGQGPTKVTMKGMWVVPLLHEAEVMDISLKQIMVNREGKDGLICKDNLRADIRVVFFIRVNPEEADIRRVAQMIGCARASDPEMLNTLFEAKFSEALKTVGKGFDFVELYSSREELKKAILEVIGDDLNGYGLDDAAIDYLEQTPLDFLDEDNILDAEGIKKIRDLTSHQITQANKIQREKEKVIKKQDVEAREAILELEKQLIEKEEIQTREIATIRAREIAEAKKVQEEQLLKSETARIARERETMIQEENKQRDVIVAQKNKERTDAVETERVQKDKDLEATDRERVVTIAQIEKEKAVEEERKNIQDVIRDRVAVEREVVEEQERMKDTQAHAEADRNKRVAITAAEQIAEESLVQRIKGAEAEAQAAEMESKRRIIMANAEREAVDKEAEGKKIMADAVAEEHASLGLAEARVMEAKAGAREKEGQAEAHVLEQQAEAEAKGIQMKGEAQADANRKLGMVDAEVSVERGLADARVIDVTADATKKQGLAEAEVIAQKGIADARGTSEKAKAMKELDGVGKDHEEFKLRLEVDKAVELAKIDIQRDIAAAQASVLGEALKAANIDIVGGEQQFFDRISQAITQGKYVDRLVDNSNTLNDIKDNLMENGNGSLVEKFRNLIQQTGLNTEDVKNMTLSALIFQLMDKTQEAGQKTMLQNLLGTVTQMGLADKTAGAVGLK